MTKTQNKNASFLERFRLINFDKHLYVIPLTAFIVLFVCSMVLIVVSGGGTVQPTDRKVVNVSIDGQKQAVPTRAKTVAELLERLEVKVSKEDIVEPALDSQISTNDFNVNIYTARLVAIEDKKTGRQYMIETATPDPRAVAKEAGLSVYPEDIIDLSIEPVEPETFVQSGLAAERVIVQRATPVTINLYGNKIELRTHARTVQDVLAERGIQALDDDIVTPAKTELLADKTQIFVVRTGSEVVTVDEVIPAPIEYIDDSTMAVGSQEVEQSGRDGKRIATYEVKYENDREVSRVLLQETIAEDPETRVIKRGTKVIISNPSANVELGQKIAAEMGWASEFSCIYQIFQRESGWSHTAQNASSGAYGIPQSLPASKMGPNYTDPEVQIRWGIGYMVARYGSPCGANAFWNQNHWY